MIEALFLRLKYIVEAKNQYYLSIFIYPPSLYSVQMNIPFW